MGGMHAIWIFSHDTKSVNNYISASSSIGNDYPAYPPAANWDLNQHQLYQDLDDITSMTLTQKRQFYGSMAYVMYPMLSPGYSMNSGDDIPTDCTIKLRVNKEYKNYVTSGKNDGMPMYGWDMEEIRTEVGSEVSLTDALDLINVVPNPYYAYSQYEENRLDSRVKITNLSLIHI